MHGQITATVQTVFLVFAGIQFLKCEGVYQVKIKSLWECLREKQQDAENKTAPFHDSERMFHDNFAEELHIPMEMHQNCDIHMHFVQWDDIRA